MRRLRSVKHFIEHGKLQTVDDDVLNIVRRVHEISDRLTVYWNDYINKFTITETSLDGAEERLVFHADVLDERVLHRLRTADHWRGREDPAHVLSDEEDFASQLDRAQERIDAAKDAAAIARRRELQEEIAAYADLDGRGIRASILVPRSYNG